MVPHGAQRMVRTAHALAGFTGSGDWKHHYTPKSNVSRERDTFALTSGKVYQQSSPATTNMPVESFAARDALRVWEPRDY